MNDFPNQTTFSFGKVELGVFDDPSSTSTAPPAPRQQADAVTLALRQKMAAVDTLDDLLYSPVSKLDRRSYQTIRDALESMAAILNQAEQKAQDYQAAQTPHRRQGGVKRDPTRRSGAANAACEYRNHKPKRRKRPCTKT